MAKKPPRPKPPRTLEEMARDLYHDDDLAARVVKDADDNKTREKIEDGHLVLPHPLDAKRHFERIDAEAAQDEE